MIKMRICYVNLINTFLLMKTAEECKSKLDRNNKIVFFLKNGVFWVVTPCGSCNNRRFGGTWLLLHQGDKNR
jgi:hypothetical protein